VGLEIGARIGADSGFCIADESHHKDVKSQIEIDGDKSPYHSLTRKSMKGAD
jgi:hypothetical protein